MDDSAEGCLTKVFTMMLCFQWEKSPNEPSVGQAYSVNISGQEGGGGGGGGSTHPPSSKLNHCLSDLSLVLTHIPILALPECNLKVVNICEIHGTGGLEVVVLFQRYVQFVRKSDEKVLSLFY